MTGAIPSGMSNVLLTGPQLLSLNQFRFSTPITLHAPDPVEGGVPGTVMVRDGSGRLFFLLADGTSAAA